MTMKKESKVECFVCGTIHHCRFITRHLKKEHKFNKNDFIKYHFKYLRDNEEQGICKCKGCNKKTTLRMSGIGLKIVYNKFCEEHTYCSRISPINIKYWIDVFGMSKKEAEENRRPWIEKATKKLLERMETDKFYIPSQIEYWLKKTNGNEKEARKLLRKRQSTFSKKICIERHGKKEGLRIWKDRQIKWQNTMKEKSVEEIERINKAKMFKRSYSKISQNLFRSIYEKIKKDFPVKDVYFATLQRNGEVKDTGNNNEFFLPVNEGRHRLLDFYIPSINKCIEFDGEYWHYGDGSNMSRNKEREILREQQIKNKKISILHVREKEYNTNEEEVVEKCLKFIYE